MTNSNQLVLRSSSVRLPLLVRRRPFCSVLIRCISGLVRYDSISQSSREPRATVELTFMDEQRFSALLYVRRPFVYPVRCDHHNCLSYNYRVNYIENATDAISVYIFYSVNKDNFRGL